MYVVLKFINVHSLINLINLRKRIKENLSIIRYMK